jgi:Fur family ferric uptake transcriptional regulator
MENRVREMIKEKGFKMTSQRIFVLEVLEENEGKHLTTEEIYKHVKSKSPEIGLATIYRTLQLFLDLRIVDSLNLNDGCVRYELASPDQAHHHHHLICEECGKVLEVKDDLLDSIEEQVLRDYDFKVNNHILKFYRYNQVSLVMTKLIRLEFGFV